MLDWWQTENQKSDVLFFIVFHVICKISNFNMWTAKHLTQASCTELTLLIFQPITIHMYIRCKIVQTCDIKKRDVLIERNLALLIRCLSLLQFLFPSEICHIKEKPHVIFRWLHILDSTNYGHLNVKSLNLCSLNSNPNPKKILGMWI